MNYCARLFESSIAFSIGSLMLFSAVQQSFNNQVDAELWQLEAVSICLLGFMVKNDGTGWTNQVAKS